MLSLIEFTESVLIFFGTALMVGTLVLSFVPILPGTALVWAVAMVFGALNEFQRFTPAAAVIATIIMIVSVSSDFWLPMMGVKTGGLTCLGALGSFAGGLIGTFVIPIPLCGTLIGCVIGALVIEAIHFRNLGRAMQAGQSAAKMFLLGYLVESACSVAVFVVYIVSLAGTG